MALEDIIQSAVDDARGGPDPDAAEIGDSLLSDEADAGAEPVVEAVVVEPVVDKPAPDTAVKPAAKAQTPEEIAASAAAKKVDENDLDSVPERDATGRTNRIPHPRVKAMVETGVKKAEAKWTTEKLEPIQRENTVYRERFKGIGVVEDKLFNKPAEFVGILRTIPGYEKFLVSADGQPATGTTTVPAAKDDPEPGPDVRDDKGTAIGYSEAGLKALRAWDRRQAVRESEERLGARIKPFEESARSAAERSEAARATSEGIAAELNQAAKWEGFIENGTEILEALKADTAEVLAGKHGPTPLLDIYHRIVLPKMKGDRNKLREDIIKELQAAPRSTAAGSAGAESRDAAVLAAKGPRTVEDIIKDSLRTLRAQGQS